MSKVLAKPDIDPVDVAAEKLYEIMEEHLNEMPPLERKKHLDAIGKAHSRLISRDSRRHSSKGHTSHRAALSSSQQEIA